MRLCAFVARRRTSTSEAATATAVRRAGRWAPPHLDVAKASR